MSTLKDALPTHLWKLAVALGLISIAIVTLGQNFQTVPPQSEALTNTETPRPTATTTFTPHPTEANVGLIPTITATPRPPTITPTPKPIHYVIAEGDVAVSIAAQYNISVDTLLRVNDVADPTLLQIGQELMIPVTITPVPSASPTPKNPPTPTPTPVYHTVEAGDTLLAIAIKYETTTEALMVTNALANGHDLSIGQELLIVPSNVDPGVPAVVHEIKEGDTFAFLSFFYGSTIEDILAANPGLDPDLLQIGQQVVIPVTSSPVNPNANPGLPRIITADPITGEKLTLQQALFQSINAQRAAYGLAPYVLDSDLVDLAQAHDQDMVSRGYFAHTTPEGVTLDDRFAQKGLNISWTGENIQRNNKGKEGAAPYALNWWMNSYVHRSNILHHRFNHIGIGVIEGPPDWFSFVLVFAER
ncbi:MAG TPA: LysM peptidoglycan-binding domain-containing protein [Anaerolineae bacterium]|nr:LysM peptidoglycan-binding domain-containing protein [Anaerolineae bacterium]MCB0224655.1 LysM peptidoglycan-binding domain-containing protein [Anaerolineae bacterium]HRV95889.1 LysM peptidoglycan-binding domain-containing protein [Anaerolineae bacterium]